MSIIIIDLFYHKIENFAKSWNFMIKFWLIKNIVVFSKIILLSYSNVLNLVNWSLTHKKHVIKIKRNKKSKYILYTLLKYNVIETISVIHNFYLVFVNHNFKKKIRIFIKTKKSIYLKVCFLNFKKKLPIFLNTSKGIMTFDEAKSNNIGGILLFSFI